MQKQMEGGEPEESFWQTHEAKAKHEILKVLIKLQFLSTKHTLDDKFEIKAFLKKQNGEILSPEGLRERKH